MATPLSSRAKVRVPAVPVAAALGTPSRDPDNGRKTRPDYFNAYAYGMGVVPRRGWDLRTDTLINHTSANPLTGLGWWVQTAPQRLLGVLLEAHPMAAQARSNDLSLAFAPGDTHLVAVSVGADGSETIDSEGTAVLDALWDRLPREVAGLAGLQVAVYDQISWAGMALVEGVPGPSGAGLSDIVTADPLTARFQDVQGIRQLQQLQSGVWVPLPPETVIAAGYHATRDNPYGAPRRAAALSEILRDYTNERRLDDIFHSVAWPHLSVGFPIVQLTEYARENEEFLLTGMGPGGRDLTPTEWAEQMFVALGKLMTGQKHDDVFIRPEGSKAETLSGGEGLAALEGTLQMRRLRLIQALDQLPGMLGITDGGTQAYTVAQYKLQQKKLEWLRAFVNGVLVLIANLELRLRGLALTARADVEPMSAIDAVADQTARRLEIANDLTLYDNGLIAAEDLAANLTGSGIADPAKLKARPGPAGTGADAVPPKSPEPADPSVPPAPPQPVQPAPPSKQENTARVFMMDGKPFTLRL